MRATHDIIRVSFKWFINLNRKNYQIALLKQASCEISFLNLRKRFTGIGNTSKEPQVSFERLNVLRKTFRLTVPSH